MEQAAMVYDNPSVHSGRLRDRAHHALPGGDSVIPRDEREAAVHSMPTISSDPLLQLLGTMHMGAILISREGRVVYLNEAGKAALAAPLGLALRGDHVVVIAPDVRRKFMTALAQACNAPYIDGSVLLSADSACGPRRALRVVSMERIAASKAQRMPHTDNGLALLCIACSRLRTPDAQLLGQLFGLTGAESALMAAVASGERLHACAARRGVSLATVRAQLRNVFVKTGAATQSELTFIAWSIPGLWIA